MLPTNTVVREGNSCPHRQALHPHAGCFGVSRSQELSASRSPAPRPSSTLHLRRPPLARPSPAPVIHIRTAGPALGSTPSMGTADGATAPDPTATGPWR